MRKLITLLIAVVAYAGIINAQQNTTIENSYGANTITASTEVEQSRSIDYPMVIGETYFKQTGPHSKSTVYNNYFTNSAISDYNTMVADDFVVPEGANWKVKQVMHTMYTFGNIDSVGAFNVVIYSDLNGKPGAEFAKEEGAKTFEFRQNPEYNAGVYDVFVTLNASINLGEGKYWLLVQPVNDTKGMDDYGNPSFNMTSLLQSNYDGYQGNFGESQTYDQAHFKAPVKAYYNFPEWTSLSDYFKAQVGYDKGLYNLIFALYGEPVANDLTVVDITTPETNIELSNDETMVVTVQNHGTANVEAGTYSIKYSVNGVQVGLDENINQAITSGKEASIQLRESLDLSEVGIHSLEAEVLFTADELTTNNTYVEEVENYGELYKCVANKNVSYNVSSGLYTDHGGLEDITEGYSNDTVVLFPELKGKRVSIEFFNTSLYSSTYFEFYNGSSVDAPLLARLYVDQVNGTVIEAANSEGALTIVAPVMDAAPTDFPKSWNARVRTIDQTNNEVAVKAVKVNKNYSWEGETLWLSADLLGKGMSPSEVMVTFTVNNQEVGQVSSTLAQGDLKEAGINWTPEKAGVYEITATIPQDQGISEEKILTIQHEILPLGEIVESFEHGGNLPEGWHTMRPGGVGFYQIRYGDHYAWDGRYYASFNTDTLVTPKVHIEPTDTLKFLFTTGVLGGNLDILYSPTPEGPWKKAGPGIEPSLLVGNRSFAFNNLEAGEYYIGFSGKGSVCVLDYIRGLNYHFDDNDLMAIEFTGESIHNVGVESMYNFRVRNMGLNTLSNYKVHLCIEENGIETILSTLNGIELSTANYANFEFNHTFTEQTEGNVYARIELAEDNETENNTSESIYTHVFESHVEVILQGDENSEEIDRSTFAYISGSYAENLYLKEDLNLKGEIKGITISYRNSLGTKIPVRIFMGETSVERLDKFQSVKNMDWVYNDTINVKYSPNDFVELYIPFENPYLYSGEENLIFAFYRKEVEDWKLTRSLQLQATATNYIAQKGHSLQSYEADADITNVNVLEGFNTSSLVKKHVPNIRFVINQSQATASVFGKVAGGEQALSGAKMNIEGFANTYYTNDTGYYEFPVMPHQSIKVFAEKYGYYTKDSVIATSANVNSELNFNLKALPRVELIGKVIANDSLKPVDQVLVNLEGYGLNLDTYTNASGEFTFAEVIGDKEYNITFSHLKYVEQVVKQYVPYQNTDMGTITLDEVEQPAFNFLAVKNIEGNVDLSWELPYTGKVGVNDPTGGAKPDNYYHNEVDENVQLGNLYKVEKPGTVTKVHLYTQGWDKTVWGGPKAEEAELTVRVYNKDRVELLEPTVFVIPDSTVTDIAIDIPDFSYTEDFYVMIHWDRVHVQTAGLRYNYFQDTNISYLVDASGDWMQISDLLGSAKRGAFNIKLDIIESAETQSRALTNFNVWRTTPADVTNKDRWVALNTEPITGTLLSDDQFDALESGYYMYILETNYTKGAAPLVYSNSLDKGIRANVNIKVTGNNEANIDGALVEFVHEDGSDLNSYKARVENGEAFFAELIKGKYFATVTKGAAYKAVNATCQVESDTVFNFELEEIIFPPVNLKVKVDAEGTQTATLLWAIGNEKTYQVDDNSSETGLSVKADATAEIGNYFAVNASGQILSADVYVIDEGLSGKVALTIYNNNQELLWESEPFTFSNNGENGFINVPVDLVNYNEAFYMMVKYLSTEADANKLGMDTDDNPGTAYFNDAENSFVQMAGWNYWGNFMIRANVLENGKKSAYNSGANGFMQNVSSTISEKLSAESFASQQVESPVRQQLAIFSIYLNDMDTPIAEQVEEYSYTFTEGEHLSATEAARYKAGVQAVFATGSTIVVATEFDYKPISVFEEFAQQFTIYPNPVKDVLYLSNEIEGTLEVFNTLGLKVKTVQGTVGHINVSDLDNGNYLVKIRTSEGVIVRQLIIK